MRDGSRERVCRREASGGIFPCNLPLARPSLGPKQRRTQTMAIQIERRELEQGPPLPPELPQPTGLAAMGWQYHVSLHGDEEYEVRAVCATDMAFSLTENSDLADVSFILPKICRNEQALSLLRKEESAQVVDGRVFIVIPGMSGDTVMHAPGELEMDALGRIVGLKIGA